MKPLLTLPKGSATAAISALRIDACGRRADGKIEIDVRHARPAASVADDELDERAARRALDVEGWRERKRRRGAD